uniref:ANIS5_cation-bd domain-containing protein n=1 Tax=Haemonchus contortus TaxID=6289 RepID=A0A7I4XXL8_HAECO
MSPILLLFLCSTGATLNGFEISLDTNALPSAVRLLEDQTPNLQPVLYNAVPVLDSSFPVEPKSSPAINDRPTNGFWPNPQAVRMFLGRNPNQQQPDSGSTAAKGPPVPSILIHQAIYPPVDEAITYPVTPEGTWDIYPGRESVPTLNPIIIEEVATPNLFVIQPTLKPEIPLQPTLKPEIPLSVLVHLISGGMGEGSGEDVDETTTPRTSDEVLPSFLIGVPDDVVQDYFKIKNNQELTKGEVKTSLEQLKQKLPPDSLKEYESSQLESEQLLAVERGRQAERIASMGEMAKQVAEQIQEIRANDSLTQNEEEVLVQEMVNTVSQELSDGLRMI